MKKFFEWPAALVLALSMPSFAGRQAPAQGARPVLEMARSTGQADPPKVAYTPRPIEKASSRADRAPAPLVPNYIRALGSAAQNARTPGSPRAGAWRVRWEAPVSSQIAAVLLTDSRIVVQRSTGWTLFDRQGKHIAEGPEGRAPITLDPGRRIFYALGGGNMLTAFGLAAGDRRFRLPLGYNESFAWPVIHRIGARLVVAGVEQPMVSSKTHAPAHSLFQVIQIGTPVKLSPYQVLLSIDLQQDLLFNDARMIPVAAGDILWAVLPDLLVRTSVAQTVDGAYADSFRAVSASVDEAGWLHLVVAPGNAADAPRELWIVTPDGQRTVRTVVATGYGESNIPPAIGYDHRVYLRTSRSVAAYSPHGALLWEARTTADIAGLAVTPDGRVVIAAGIDLFVADGRGHLAHLATLPGVATTAPVVASDGEIVVGAGGAVLSLAAH